MSTLSPRSRIPAAKAHKLLRCYAERLDPAVAANRTGLSLNTVYDQHSRIRWRLIEVGYYRDASLTKIEKGLSKEAKAKLHQRRGLEDGDIYAHATEVIELLEEWPFSNVLRQLRKIIELTGPLDKLLALSEKQTQMVLTYVRCVRTKLIEERAANSTRNDEGQFEFADHVKLASERQRKSYRNI